MELTATLVEGTLDRQRFRNSTLTAMRVLATLTPHTYFLALLGLLLREAE